MSNLTASANLPSSSPEYHFSFKVVVLGDGAVGKTALLQREVGSVNTAHSRVGVNFFRKYYKWSKKTYRIEYWDCPGSLRYASLISRYCAGASAAVLIFDPNNKSTFYNLNQWKKTIARCSPPLKIVIGTPFARSARQISNEEAQEWANANSMDYISSNSPGTWGAGKSYTTPNADVFQQIFAILTKSIPRVPEASLLLKKGVLLGSKLLNDYAYQKTLFQRTNKHGSSNPFVRNKIKQNNSIKNNNNGKNTKVDESPRSYRKRNYNKGRHRKNNMNKEVTTPKSNSNKSFLTPVSRNFDLADEEIDREASLPERTGKETGLLLMDRKNNMESKTNNNNNNNRRNATNNKKISALPLQLDLEHVYGCSSRYVRKNVCYSGRGNIMYSAGIVGIELNPVTKRQKFFTGSHSDDIISMAIFHASGRVSERPMFSRDLKKNKKENDDNNISLYEGNESLIATGEIGANPSIFIWESNSMACLNELRGIHTRGVIQLAFNKHGDQLASIGADPDHTLIVYDWQRNKPLYNSPTSPDKVFCLRYLPEISSMIATAGHKHIYFWEQGHKGLVVTKSNLPEVDKKTYLTILDIAFLSGGRKIVGAAEQGHLCAWDRKDITSMLSFSKGSVKNAHPGGITCLHYITGQNVLISGGKEGSIKLWDMHLTLVGTYTTHVTVSLDPGIRSIDSSTKKGESKLLIGTRGNEIFEIAIKGNRENYSRNEFGTILHNGRAINAGHSGNELWGLTCNPVDPCMFATCGDDCTVRIWHTRSKKQINITEEGVIPTNARAIDFSPDGSILAVGLGGKIGERRTFGYATHAGKIIILNVSTLEVEAVERNAKEMISRIRFSPDGSMIAVASYDTNIYLYNYSKSSGLHFSKTLSGHTAYVLHMDFSIDGRILRSDDGNKDTNYWDAYGGKVIFNSTNNNKRKSKQSLQNMNEIRNIQWASKTCPLDENCKGIWTGANSGVDDIRAMDFYPSRTPMNHLDGIIAIANDYGKIQLYKSPCLENVIMDAYRGHSVHVTNVKFTSDGKKMLSIGGLDRCIMQWNIRNDNK